MEQRLKSPHETKCQKDTENRLIHTEEQHPEHQTFFGQRARPTKCLGSRSLLVRGDRLYQCFHVGLYLYFHKITIQIKTNKIHFLKQAIENWVS
jgi:hypothetical protein